MINHYRYAVGVLLLFLLLAATACMTRSKVMDVHAFAMVPTGSEITSVENVYGSPVEIQSKGNKQVYIYVERINLGTQTVRQTRYYFVVEEGKIISKYSSLGNAPAYDEIYNPDYMDSIN